MVFLLTLVRISLFAPNILGDPENFIPANPLVTPVHIKPEWYFLWAYAILRSISRKLGGVVAIFSALLILFLVPFLNSSYKRVGFGFYPANQVLFWVAGCNAILLTWIGGRPVEYPYEGLGKRQASASESKEDAKEISVEAEAPVEKPTRGKKKEEPKKAETPTKVETSIEKPTRGKRGKAVAEETKNEETPVKKTSTRGTKKAESPVKAETPVEKPTRGKRKAAEMKEESPAKKTKSQSTTTHPAKKTKATPAKKAPAKKVAFKSAEKSSPVKKASPSPKKRTTRSRK